MTYHIGTYNSKEKINKDGIIEDGHTLQLSDSKDGLSCDILSGTYKSFSAKNEAEALDKITRIIPEYSKSCDCDIHFFEINTTKTHKHFEIHRLGKQYFFESV